MKKALSNLRRCRPDLFYNLEWAFRSETSMLSPPRQTGKHSNAHHSPTTMGREAAMVYKLHTDQSIPALPRSYRYVTWMGGGKGDPGSDGFLVAALECPRRLFSRRGTAPQQLFKEWGAFRGCFIRVQKKEILDRVLTRSPSARNIREGDRVRIHSPRKNLQIRQSGLCWSNDFVAYLDAFGGTRCKACLIDWKTTTSRYPDDPDGLLR